MRLGILDRGYGPGPKLLFAVIRRFSGHPVPDAAKLVFYRPDFYGAGMKELTHAAMRGPSAWSVGDRELMAAYVSKVNECAFCVGAHSATAGRAYQDGTRVAAVLADLDSAPIAETFRATLRMLGKLTREGTLGADNVRAVLSAGVSPQQIEDALAVCFAFNTTDRLAEENPGAWLTTVAIQTAASALYAIPDRRGQGCKPCVSTSQRPLNPGLEATGR